MLVTATNYKFSGIYQFDNTFNTFLTIDLGGLYGCTATAPDSYPHLIEKLPQWLSGPSPVLPAAGSPAGYPTGIQTVFGLAAIFIQLWHGLTKNA